MIYPIYIATMGDFLTVTSSKFHKSFGYFETRDVCNNGYTVLEYDGINSINHMNVKGNAASSVIFCKRKKLK